jgi:hypothetical protein
MARLGGPRRTVATLTKEILTDGVPALCDDGQSSPTNALQARRPLRYRFDFL